VTCLTAAEKDATSLDDGVAKTRTENCRLNGGVSFSRSFGFEPAARLLELQHDCAGSDQLLAFQDRDATRIRAVL
jgi:hypothetical protein